MPQEFAAYFDIKNIHLFQPLFFEKDGAGQRREGGVAHNAIKQPVRRHMLVSGAQALLYKETRVDAPHDGRRVFATIFDI